MVLSRICALLCLGCLLAGCGTTRPVVVVEKDDFMKMAHNMPKELKARNLLDSDGAYTAPMSFKGLKSYGDILFHRLSPSFMQEATTAHDVYLGDTFAATILPDSRVRHFDNGFSINHATEKLTVKMIGITDWNGDGQDEWIVSCFVEPKRGGRTRIYYLLVPPPLNDKEKLKGTVAAIYECFGLACNLYVRDSKVIERDAADPLVPPTVVQDVVPGLQPVTTPPSKNTSKSDGLEERNL